MDNRTVSVYSGKIKRRDIIAMIHWTFARCMLFVRPENVRDIQLIDTVTHGEIITRSRENGRYGIYNLIL